MTNLEPHHLSEVMYQFGMFLAAQIEMEAMKAENKQREHLGQSMAYVDSDFASLIEKYGIHHNALVESQRRMQQ